MPRKVWQASPKDAAGTMGIWKTEPAEERMTFGLEESTLPLTLTIARAPIASAVRMMVPALPGSLP